MEFLLHYVWKHHLYPSDHFVSDRGETVEVIDVGVHNLLHAGPDFFNAKFRLAGMVWAGNVEIHLKSSDWYRHHHDQDPAYNNVVLHVVAEVDGEVRTQDGKSIPQIVVPIPPQLRANYEELIAEETYPPCYRVIPDVPSLIVHQWMSRLTIERLEAKTARIQRYLDQTGGDWERAFFITLARNFGFGTNADAFEQWALTIEPSQVGKHRDNPFQVEAFFMGQAGLLETDAWKEEQQDDYFKSLRAEYAFLKNKFDLKPVDRKIWKFGRMRPQNFPTVRLSQLTQLYVERRVDLSRLLETTDAKALRALFRVRATPYWQTHYAFGEVHEPTDKVLQTASLNLLLINSVVPLFFAYARSRKDEVLAECALQLLENLPAERNYITRCWERAGIRVSHAADSQALIQLRQHYCDRKDCLRCRFGSEYLRRKGQTGEVGEESPVISLND